MRVNHSVLGQIFTSNYTSNWPVEALFLSAGNQTELIIPSTCDGCEMQTCTLPDIGSEHYYSHTVNGLFVCGGGRTADHCMHLLAGWTLSVCTIRSSFFAGSWKKSHSLPGGRWARSSALAGEKLVLIGGEDGNTTDILEAQNGETKKGFELKHFSMKVLSFRVS